MTFDTFAVGCRSFPLYFNERSTYTNIETSIYKRIKYAL